MKKTDLTSREWNQFHTLLTEWKMEFDKKEAEKCINELTYNRIKSFEMLWVKSHLDAIDEYNNITCYDYSEYSIDISSIFTELVNNITSLIITDTIRRSLDRRIERVLKTELIEPLLTKYNMSRNYLLEGSSFNIINDVGWVLKNTFLEQINVVTYHPTVSHDLACLNKLSRCTFGMVIIGNKFILIESKD